MRKSLLAMAALMGVATLPAHAWRVNIDKDTFADIGFSTIVRGISEGKRSESPDEKSRINFYVPQFNITASGQVNKLVYFNMNLEGRAANDSPVVRDSFIGLKFADEFRVQAGLMRAPFSRVALTSAYVQLFPYTPRYRDIGMLVVEPTNVGTVVNPRDAGVVVWGNVADGMVKYYLGVTDGDTIGSSTDNSLATTIRLQFTPTMLGYKPEKGYTLSDTYLGRQNVLSVGFGYRVVGRSGTGVRDTKMWTVDMLYEQKFGNLVPNLQVGYINQKDTRGRANEKASQLYAQGQLLFDQMMGFGKPALAIRLEQNQNKNIHGAGANENDPKVTRLGVWGHYYIKGQDAKVSLGLDSVSLNSEAKNRSCAPTTFTSPRNCRNFTDITLQLQTRF
ncbi:porin [Thermocrinis sp.]|uniref:porin n=1 Tax=Thermocrinis sp. TaxID=2024383 RepID=UPI003BFD20F8